MNIKLSEKVVTAEIDQDTIYFYDDNYLILADMHFNDKNIFRKVSKEVKKVLPVNVPIPPELIVQWENE